MTVSPAVFPLAGISGAQASVWNALMSYRGVPVPLSGQNVAARFEPMDAPIGDIPALLLQFGAGFRAIVAVTSFPFDKLFGTPFSVEDMRALPVSLREALNEGILEILWGALPDHRLQTYKVQAAGALSGLADPQTLQSFAWFDVQVAGLMPEPVSFILGCPPERLTQALVKGDIAPRQVWPGLKAQITQQASFTLGRIAMSVSEIRRLSPGDVIVLGADVPGQCSLRSGQSTYRFEKGESGWAATGVVVEVPQSPSFEPMQGGIMSQSDSSFMQGGLQLTLDFDLGQKSVSLAEVETWQPGAVVQLDVPSSNNGVEVTIRSNGQVIGLGDLVRIDDRLAVRLNRLFL